MNKRDLIDKAKKKYDQTVRQIEKVIELTDKVESLLPKNWKISYFPDNAYPIVFKNTEKNQSELEFKFVCKLIEELIGNKMSREAYATKEHGLYLFEAVISHYVGDIDLSIKVVMKDPTHTCEITYREETIIKVEVSSECLGLQ
jgi:hypothetical protein